MTSATDLAALAHCIDVMRRDPKEAQRIDDRLAVEGSDWLEVAKGAAFQCQMAALNCRRGGRRRCLAMSSRIAIRMPPSRRAACSLPGCRGSRQAQYRRLSKPRSASLRGDAEHRLTGNAATPTPPRRGAGGCHPIASASATPA